MTLSVFFATRKWSPAVGGMETYCVELTSELAARCRLEVVALERKSPPGLVALLLFALRAAWRYLRQRHAPDVLHIGDMAAWPLALLAWVRGRPAIVISAHGTDVSYHRRGGLKGRLYGLYLRLGARLLGKAARVIANSAATAEVASETGWHTTAVVPLATRSGPLHPPSGAHDGMLLFAGRLVERKGCRWFADEVLPLLPQEIGLKVAGPVTEEREGEILGHERIKYLGSLEPDRLREAYRSALAVIVPNVEPPSGEFEGFGLVAAEAAAAGAVVLAANCGGLREAVIDGQTGYLVESGNPEAWREEVLRIAGWSSEERRGYLEQAVKRANAHYRWDRVAAETLKVYSASCQV